VLITFEGIDGCGKSTQIGLLKEYFDFEDRNYFVFREPGGTNISEKIRALLLHDDDEMHPVTELLLFSAARSQLLIEKVKPLLEKGEIVILDRFYDSTTAYQGFGRELGDHNELITLNKLASHNTVPDLTFYLRISPEDAAARTKGFEKDRMESSGDSFFQRVVDGYDTLSDSEDRFYTLNAMLPPKEIHAQIIEIIESF
jgi:dTMP kinase